MLIETLTEQYYMERPGVQHTIEDENRTQCTIEYLRDNGLNDDMILEIIANYANVPAMTVNNLPQFPVYVFRADSKMAIDEDMPLFGTEYNEWKRYSGYRWITLDNKDSFRVSKESIAQLMSGNTRNSLGRFEPYNVLVNGKLYTHRALRIEESGMAIDRQTGLPINSFYSEPRLSFTFRDFIDYICNETNSDFEQLYTIPQSGAFNRLLGECKSIARETCEPIDILLFTVDAFLEESNVNSIRNISHLSDYVFDGKKKYEKVYRQKLMLTSSHGEYKWREKPCHT